MKKLERSNLYEQIAEEIRNYIIMNEIKPGERLPTERELAEMLGVSRTSVREGIRLLETLQFLEVKPKRGITVKKLELKPFVKQFSQRLLLDKNRFSELVEARRVLEVALVKLAALRATEDDLEQLAASIQLMAEQLERGEEIKEADLKFHQGIFAAAKNSVLQGFQSALLEFFESGELQSAAEEGRRKTLKEHQQIYQAIKDRKPQEAAKFMLQHLETYESQQHEEKISTCGI